MSCCPAWFARRINFWRARDGVIHCSTCAPAPVAPTATAASTVHRVPRTRGGEQLHMRHRVVPRLSGAVFDKNDFNVCPMMRSLVAYLSTQDRRTN
jgi:hypothetical protein